jgi:hypothetical protein
MAPRVERRKPSFVVVDRGGVADKVRATAERLGAPIQVVPMASVLEVLGENGPASASGLVATTAATGPFLLDLLRWTDRDHESRIPAAVVGTESDESAVQATLGRDHVRWIDAGDADGEIERWLQLALEVHDLRGFHAQHEAIAAQLREARMRLFYGEIETYTPPEGPPCGPPLPTAVEEIQSLKEAKAQFERGLIRAAVRESGSLKDASAALGISYTSLWRRMR